jgi:hypothetical protein
VRTVSIIRVISILSAKKQSQKKKQPGNPVASTRDLFSSPSPEERAHSEDVGVDVWITLKWILGK